MDHFRERDYDLILMDWQMPLMNGIEATARIRAMPGGLTMPIIGTTSGKAHAECLKGGMNEVVPKPFLFDKNAGRSFALDALDRRSGQAVRSLISPNAHCG